MTETFAEDKTAWIHELEENLWQMWANVGCGPGCALHDEGDLLWFETPIPIMPYNGIVKCLVTADVDRRIDKVLRHFAEREVAFMWVMHPSSLPLDLADRLEARGLYEAEVVPGMVRTLDSLPEVPPLPEGVMLRKVTAESDASAFYDFAAWRWGVPEAYTDQMSAIMTSFRFGQPGSRAHMWQAWQKDQPIAKAGMYLTSGSAGIYAVVTRPEARRRGLARILTLVALTEARRRGQHLAVLHSSPAGEGLYRSMGFETAAEFRLFSSEEAHI